MVNKVENTFHGYLLLQKLIKHFNSERIGREGRIKFVYLNQRQEAKEEAATEVV